MMAWKVFPVSSCDDKEAEENQWGRRPGSCVRRDAPPPPSGLPLKAWSAHQRSQQHWGGVPSLAPAQPSESGAAFGQDPQPTPLHSKAPWGTNDGGDGHLRTRSLGAAATSEARDGIF